MITGHASIELAVDAVKRGAEHVIERAVLLSNNASRLDEADLRIEAREPETAARAADEIPDHLLTLEEMETRHVERVVRFEGGSIDRAAARLGVSRSTLYQKLKRVRERKTTQRGP
jgi:DNA-binding NtrC family response regulator